MAKFSFAFLFKDYPAIAKSFTLIKEPKLCTNYRGNFSSRVVHVTRAHHLRLPPCHIAWLIFLDSPLSEAGDWAFDNFGWRTWKQHSESPCERFGKRQSVKGLNRIEQYQFNEKREQLAID